MDLKEQLIKNYGEKVRVRVCGIYISKGKILLIKHFFGEKNHYLWSPTGGAIEYGESIIETLKREFLEETGLLISVHQLICK